MGMHAGALLQGCLVSSGPAKQDVARILPLPARMGPCMAPKKPQALPGDGEDCGLDLTGSTLGCRLQRAAGAATGGQSPAGTRSAGTAAAAQTGRTLVAGRAALHALLAGRPLPGCL